MMNEIKPFSKDSEIESKEFWSNLIPSLTITDNPFCDNLPAYNLPSETNKEQIIEEGYFKFDSVLPPAQIAVLEEAVRSVVKSGFPAVFCLVYDEPWRIMRNLSTSFSKLFGLNYDVITDSWIYYIKSFDEKSAENLEESGWGVHRDGNNVIDLIDSAGRPLMWTVWIPLTEVTPESSCMSVLPMNLDPNYPDNLGEKFISLKCLRGIRALPVKKGDIIGWNDYVLHWSSPPSRYVRDPRISLGFRLQTKELGRFATSDAFKTFDFKARLAVVGKNMTYYQKRVRIPEKLVGFAKRQSALYHLLAAKHYFLKSNGKRF